MPLEQLSLASVGLDICMVDFLFRWTLWRACTPGWTPRLFSLRAGCGAGDCVLFRSIFRSSIFGQTASLKSRAIPVMIPFTQRKSSYTIADALNWTRLLLPGMVNSILCTLHLSWPFFLLHITFSVRSFWSLGCISILCTCQEIPVTLHVNLCFFHFLANYQPPDHTEGCRNSRFIRGCNSNAWSYWGITD